MPKVMTAAGSTIGAEAAAIVADAGGNAVDAALAAVIVSVCTEPGIIAPAAGAFITVWEPGQDPVTIDAYCEMPGRADPDRIGTGRNEVFMTYGGGMRTNIGYSSVATPGAFAGFDIASSRYGAVPWAEIFGPAIRDTREGFPLPGVTARASRRIRMAGPRCSLSDPSLRERSISLQLMRTPSSSIGRMKGSAI